MLSAWADTACWWHSYRHYCQGRARGFLHELQAPTWRRHRLASHNPDFDAKMRQDYADIIRMGNIIVTSVAFHSICNVNNIPFMSMEWHCFCTAQAVLVLGSTALCPELSLDPYTDHCGDHREAGNHLSFGLPHLYTTNKNRLDGFVKECCCCGDCCFQRLWIAGLERQIKWHRILSKRRVVLGCTLARLL